MIDKRLQWADKITLERIDLMHPKLKAELLEQYLTINSKLAKGIRLRFSQTLRTIEEQDALYAQGRTKSGKIVTNAKGGQSIHNYGLAFDIVLLYDKDGNGTFETASWDERKDFDKNGKKDWFEVVDFFKARGWNWGGSFKLIYDSPHFEKTFNNSWQKLKEKIDKGDIIISGKNKYPRI